MTESVALPLGQGGKAFWTEVPLALGQRYQVQASQVTGHYHGGATVLLAIAPDRPDPDEPTAFSLPPNAVCTIKRTTPDSVWARAAVDAGDGEQPCAGRLSYEATA